MPELPELEVVTEVLNRRIVGAEILQVDLIPPGSAIVLRDMTRQGFESLVGAQFASVRRRGKFLLFDCDSAGGPHYLAINPKLTGRLQLAVPTEKRRAKTTHLVLTLSTGQELRYIDQKRMGQVYLCALPPEEAELPGLVDIGPEPLEIALDEFRQRLRKFRGEIKGVLVRSQFVAGIGNAYADEILWAAQLHPYRKRPSLSDDEIERLYRAMRDTLIEATDKVRKEMREAIHTKPRDFLNIHMKAGQPCPRCGGNISQVKANRRITNFCRTCQPGGLIRGM